MPEEEEEKKSVLTCMYRPEGTSYVDHLIRRCDVIPEEEEEKRRVY